MGPMTIVAADALPTPTVHVAAVAVSLSEAPELCRMRPLLVTVATGASFRLLDE